MFFSSEPITMNPLVSPVGETAKYPGQRPREDDQGHKIS